MDTAYKGMEVVVDDQDYNYLMQRKWHVQCVRDGSLFYACRTVYDAEVKQTVFMHQEVACRCGLEDGRYDHVNGNGLDNQRKNLRFASGCQNQQNRGPNRNNCTGFKGVYFESFTGKYRAEITANRKRQRLGRFSTAIEAAKAYNRAASLLHGEFACLNKIPFGKMPNSMRENTGVIV
jgi:hypothetical protein